MRWTPSTAPLCAGPDGHHLYTQMILTALSTYTQIQYVMHTLSREEHVNFYRQQLDGKLDTTKFMRTVLKDNKSSAWYGS